MNDVDFPVARVLEGIDAAARGRARAGQDQHGGEARRERGMRSCRWRATSAAAATSCASSSTWTSAHTNGWRMDDVVPARRDRRHDRSPRCRSSPSTPNYPAKSPSAGATRRQRRDRRHRLGDAGVLPRLHARAAVDRRQALHVPVRDRRLRPARAAARRRDDERRSRDAIAAIWRARADRYSEIRTREHGAVARRSR